MRRRRLGRRQVALAAAGLAAAALVLAFGGEREPGPASTEALNAVAARNEDAAIAAAARMKAESEASARATDARLRRSEFDEPGG